MLYNRNTLSNHLKFTHHFQLFHRCLGKKSSYHCYETKKREKNGGGGEKGHVQLLKSKGQHLLTNPRVLDAIVRNSNINPDDTVLEIGPGTGNLTLKLLELANKVVAVEIDKRMVEILRERVARLGLQDRLTIVCGDALKTEFPEFNLVVANIPYGISSPLLAKLIFGATVNPFRSATLLLQKEFTRRLLANPGDTEFNRLAVNIKLLAQVEFVMDVSKRNFVPCPKVDSSVVRIYPKSEIPDVDLEEWWAFTRTCFGKKNKTLGALFRQKKKLMELMQLSKAKGLCRDSSGKCHDYDGKDDGDEECSSDEGNFDLFRGKIINILESGGYLDRRPSKLSNDELLRKVFRYDCLSYSLLPPILHVVKSYCDMGIFCYQLCTLRSSWTKS